MRPCLALHRLCPPQTAKIDTLVDITRANVQTSMFAMLSVGALIFLWAAIVAMKDKEARRSATFKLGFGSALIVWAVAAAFVTIAFDVFVAFGHYAAAASLFFCVFIVACINARRDDKATLHRHWYAFFAILLIVVAIAGAILTLIGVITVFWLELAVAACFIIFWGGQTWEEMQSQPRPAVDR